MPPCVPSARLLATLKASIYSKQFICAFCIARRPLGNASKPFLRRPWMRFVVPSTARSASQIASVTAVNAQKSIPAEHKELHNALTALEGSAAVYTNLSQLQLALRGLESRDSVTRVAVLGINDQEAAKRLAHTLLADPLTEEAEWERILKEVRYDRKALLIRYGDDLAFERGHPLLQTLTIPSTLLRRNKLELLAPSAGVAIQSGATESNALLVPSLDTPTSETGRVSTVTYPVHKAVLLGSGFRGLSRVAEFSSLGQTAPFQEMLRLVIDVNWDPGAQPQEDVLFVNLAKGEKAIQELRKSLQHSQDYEHDWLSSHISSLEPFLSTPMPSDLTPNIKPALQNLITVLLENTEEAVVSQEAEVENEEREETIVDNASRKSIQEAITSWAELAHTELRDELEKVFASRTWRKLSWWKLLWRVDDVDMIASEVLRRTYLINAEKNLIFLAGRMQEAGFYGRLPIPAPEESKPLFYARMDDIPGLYASDVHPERRRPLDSIDDEQNNTPQPIVTDPAYRFPQALSISRLNLLETTVPPLTALAQRYLLSSLSTTSLSAGFSTLIYLSSPLTSFYEAGIFVSLGLVWSARRLQKQWDKGKKDWVQAVELEGKGVLDAIEKRIRRTVANAGKREPDPVAAEERRKAREAVERVREVLGKME